MRADALVFPGQGAQSPGMGAALVAQECSPELLDIAAAAGLDLRRLLVDGGVEELRPTQVAQPALFYTGVALLGVLREAGVRAEFAAGHSLGEYCALVAAGSLSPEAGMELVLRRAEAMALAPEGTMAAVLGLDAVQLERICAEVTGAGAVCVLANDNSPAQQVVSGTLAGVQEVGRRAREAGARKVVPLQVGGAFHSPLMAEPARRFAAAIAETRIADPEFPVAAGALGRLVSTAADVRRALEIQLESPVRWTATVLALGAAGAGRFIECGPGNTLGALIRRILPDPLVVQVASPAQARELGPAAPA